MSLLQTPSGVFARGKSETRSQSGVQRRRDAGCDPNRWRRLADGSQHRTPHPPIRIAQFKRFCQTQKLSFGKRPKIAGNFECPTADGAEVQPRQPARLIKCRAPPDGIDHRALARRMAALVPVVDLQELHHREMLFERGDLAEHLLRVDVCHQVNAHLIWCVGNLVVR